jgi:uncharacterized membrane protein
MVAKSKVKSQKSKASWFLKVIIAIAYCLMPNASNAQCAMCRASLESEGNTMKAEAVNDGIVYLMVIPYILVGIVGVFVYRMYANKRQ